MLASGTLLQGRYLITRPIGRGGMAAVYEAVDSRLQNTVAVKQMTATGTESDRAFEHEAQLLAGLRHHALPVVIDYFIDADGHFLVMQYIDGEDLALALQRAGGALDPEEVRTWARAVLDALAYLHEHQPPVVHRDIKPENLKRTPSGEIVLLDFGLAKGTARPRPESPEGRSVFGYTLHYAPPEQLEWRPTDARSDIYALGATLFHLLTGVAPPSALQRTAAVRGGSADPLCQPSVLNARVDASFDRVVVRAMALSASDRYETAAGMRAGLSGPAGAAVRRRPRGRVRTERRVDSAMPSQVEVGRQADLVIQVRFPGSPLLGLEDWPTRRKPPRIERATESVKVIHDPDPQTGETLPARLRVRVVAPDFTIDGQSDFVLEVPINDYSKRLALLLTPQRSGYCRVNVEVHGTDGEFLGLVPVETEAVGHVVPDRTMQAATLVLGALTRQVVEAIQRGELPETGHSEPHAVVDANTQQSPEGEPAAVPSNQWEHLGSVSTRLTPPPSSRRSDALAVDQAVPGTQARSRLRRAAVIAPVAVAAIAAAVLLRMGRDVSAPPSQKTAVESAAKPPAPPVLPSAPGPALATALNAPPVERRPQVRPSHPPGRPITEEIARLDSETDIEYLYRIGRVRAEYANAERILASGQWLSAQQAFDRLAADYPQFRDVAAKAALARAKVKEAASAAVASGRRLEDAGDFPAAVREYLRAREFGAEVGTDIDRANGKARSSAERLMTRAKVAEDFNRAEAIELYRQIVALLPAGDPNRTYAEERLRQLTP